MNNKKLSICIPTYNRAKILDKTLFNIVSQNISQVEIVVSDNASEDITEEIVKKYTHYGVKYYKNAENYGVVYNFLKVLELATSEFVTLLSDEDDINIENIILSIDEMSSSKVGLILGDIKIKDGGKYRSYSTKFWKKNFRTFLAFGFSVGYMSGIIFSRHRIDFDDLWLEYNSTESFGLLDIYPHVYLFNKLLLELDLATYSRQFVERRETGLSYIGPINRIYIEPLARLDQLEKNLSFIRKNSFFNSFEISILVTKLLSSFKFSLQKFKSMTIMQLEYFSLEPVKPLNIDSFMNMSFNILQTKGLVYKHDLLLFKSYLLLLEFYFKIKKTIKRLLFLNVVY